MKITDSQQVRNEFSHLRDIYIDKLVENLDSRFPEDELQTLECLDIILNPKRYPDGLASIGDYGTGQLNQLLTFYDTCVDAERQNPTFCCLSTLQGPTKLSHLINLQNCLSQSLRRSTLTLLY